ncbi:myo-inosose-2 dehydratase [Sinanaerobacter chloroacetimidivorans]|jgi:inosose dehydratase|uniref:Inosose dehydratase n=1 Tax=Sinanaerobacter chloroacetimidivorans TaxID=2818044 RepID=A0A8J8B470_9FIRM|nr:myo-inosose-2 dehydratase [Sinanaerobacter chloroacetimidivorans]MBR0600461.1 myo-inosose-2 dehydratase [Sinanaerobacter chloroacetimidivorans]
MDSNKVKVGIAPIGWTNDDLPDLGSENTFEQCVSEMALAGFTGTEVGNKYPRDTDALKKALNLRGIEICNAWFSACFTTKSEEEVLEEFKAHRDFLYEMGAKVIGAAEVGNSIQGLSDPIFEAKPVYTEEQWEKVVKGYNKMADLAEEKGMKLTCHHHMGTGVQTMEEIDRFMSSVQDNVYLLYDSGHIYYSEGTYESCLELLKKYVKRVGHVHLKDIRPEVVAKVRAEKMSFLDGVRAGTFTVPGDGAIDFGPIFKILEDNGYEGWMVVEAEQDPAKANPLEYALKARKYIKEKSGL